METSELGARPQALAQPSLIFREMREMGGEMAAEEERTALPPRTTAVASRSRHARKTYPRTTRLLIQFVALVVGLALWQAASATKMTFLVSFENVPTPVAVASALLPLLQEGEFYLHILKSMQRILLGFVSASVLGVVLGILIGRYRLLNDILSPYIELLRPIPAVAWIPLAIVMWPTEESSIVFITFLGALFPVIMNTVHGVQQTPEVLVRAARSLGAGPRAIFWHVVLAAALPSITTGLAIGMGVSWFSLLAGEIISGQYGIGYFTWNAYSLVEYEDIIIGMIAIGLLGTSSTAIVRWAMSPFLRWQTLGGNR